MTEVDPRDQTWELSEPHYRAHFHDQAGTTYEHEITGADVSAVIAWAESERNGRSFVLYACVPHDGLGLVQLLGEDPNSHSRSR